MAREVQRPLIPSGDKVRMDDVVALALRLVHIVFGIAWIGAVFYSVAVLRVVVPRMEVSARKEMMLHLIPVAVHYIPISAVMTMLSGTILWLYMGRLDPSILLGTAWGLTLLVALAITLATFAFGMTEVIGGARRIHVHTKEEACDHHAEVSRLQTRFNRGQVVVLILGLLIIGLMTVATGALHPR